MAKASVRAFECSSVLRMSLLITCASLIGIERSAVADTVILNAQANSGGSWSDPVWGPTVTGTSQSGLGNSFGTVVTGTPTVSGTGGGAQLGTWATVTQVTGSAVTVDMAWRTRTLNESFKAEPGGNPTQPPLDMANLYFGLASDVLKLDGLNGKTFVLQMSYVANSAWFDEFNEAKYGCMMIMWYNPAKQLWVDASKGNSHNDPNRITNFQGSWASAGSPLTLGSWGVDTAANVAWAVLDHNSQFAVVPEPSSMALLAGGAIAFIGRCLPRRRSASH